MRVTCRESHPVPGPTEGFTPARGFGCAGGFTLEPHWPEECLALSEGDSTHSECAAFFRIIPRNFSVGPVMVSPIPSLQEAPEHAGER